MRIVDCKLMNIRVPFAAHPDEMANLTGTEMPSEQKQHVRVYEVNTDVVYRQNKDLVWTVYSLSNWLVFEFRDYRSPICTRRHLSRLFEQIEWIFALDGKPLFFGRSLYLRETTVLFVSQL